MRFMGIDYGTKRIGIALSDEAGQFALPRVVLANSKKVVAEIAAICRAEEVGKIVLGESRNFKQQANRVMKKITPFKQALAVATGLAIDYEPEFLTSRAAAREIGVDDFLDARAAALILKSYLDRKRHG